MCANPVRCTAYYGLTNVVMILTRIRESLGRKSENRPRQLREAYDATPHCWA